MRASSRTRVRIRPRVCTTTFFWARMSPRTSTCCATVITSTGCASEGRSTTRSCWRSVTTGFGRVRWSTSTELPLSTRRWTRRSIRTARRSESSSKAIGRVRAFPCGPRLAMMCSTRGLRSATRATRARLRSKYRRTKVRTNVRSSSSTSGRASAFRSVSARRAATALRAARLSLLGIFPARAASTASPCTAASRQRASRYMLPRTARA